MLFRSVKNYTTPENLSTEWIDFVANAYSATHVKWDEMGRDPEWEFMFASTHPWAPSKFWTATEPDSVREACNARPALIPEGGLIDERVQALSSRLFLWLISRRQDDMTMARRFRGYVMAEIKGS